jgi:multidrug efflux pump subunit AcrA (membrane-fusion protein)
MRGKRFERTAKWLLAPLLACLSLACEADSWSAVLDWGRRLEIGPLVGGTVTSAPADTGDRVSAGAVLVEIDPAPYLSRVRAAEARVESTRADYESSTQHHERQAELYDIGSLSTVELQEAEFALKRAESAHRLAQVEHELALYELEKTKTRAPVDGWIIDKRVFVGQNVSASQIIPISYVMVPDGEYIAVISPPPGTDAIQSIGTSVEVAVKGKSYRGSVAFPPAPGRLAPGQSAVKFRAEGELFPPGTPATVRAAE